MFEIKGLDQLYRVFSTTPEKIKRELEQAVDKSGDAIIRRAQSKAPGRLKNSLDKKKPKNTGGYIQGQIQFKKGYAYGVPVELGHGLVYYGHPTSTYIDERPFLRPAADESMDEVEQILNNAVDKVLKEFSG